VDVVGDTVISTASDNTLNGIDINTGALLWEVGLGAESSTGGQSSPVCVGVLCYASGSGGDFSAFNVITRKAIWTMSSTKTRFRSVVGDYVIAAENFFDNNQSGIVVSSRHDASEIHSFKLSDVVWANPRVHGSKLFVPTEVALEVYDLGSWELLWTAPFFGESGFYRAGNLTFAANVVALNSTIETTGDDLLDERVLVGLNINTGALLWSIKIGDIDAFAFNPQSDGTTIYSAVAELERIAGFKTKKGYPFAVEPASGNILWSRRNHIAEGPLVAAGQMFVPDLFDSSVGGAGENYFGFASLDVRNGDVSMRAPSVKPNYAIGPVLVHNEKVYRPEPFVGWADAP